MVFGVQVSAETAAGPIRFAPGWWNSGVPPATTNQGDPPRISEIDATSNQVVDPNAGALAAR
jgi:hypothetical protein